MKIFKKKKLVDKLKAFIKNIKINNYKKIIQMSLK